MMIEILQSETTGGPRLVPNINSPKVEGLQVMMFLDLQKSVELVSNVDLELGADNHRVGVEGAYLLDWDNEGIVPISLEVDKDGGVVSFDDAGEDRKIEWDSVTNVAEVLSEEAYTRFMLTLRRVLNTKRESSYTEYRRCNDGMCECFINILPPVQGSDTAWVFGYDLGMINLDEVDSESLNITQ